jgi:drug/metabolite transporter (DMT)-like permease
VIWGIPYFLIKVAVAEVPPLLVAWCRLLLATGVLLPIAWQRGALGSLRGHTAALCAFALAEFAIPFAVISCGEQWISSSVTGILIATVPLWVVLLAWLGSRWASSAWSRFSVSARSRRRGGGSA